MCLSLDRRRPLHRALLIAVFAAMSALWFAALVAAATGMSELLSRPPVRRRLDRIAGVVLVGFGLRPATSTATR